MTCAWLAYVAPGTRDRPHLGSSQRRPNQRGPELWPASSTRFVAPERRFLAKIRDISAPVGRPAATTRELGVGSDAQSRGKDSRHDGARSGVVLVGYDIGLPREILGQLLRPPVNVNVTSVEATLRDFLAPQPLPSLHWLGRQCPDALERARSCFLHSRAAVDGTCLRDAFVVTQVLRGSSCIHEC